MKLHTIPALAFTALAILCSANSFSQERTYFDGRSASDENVPPFSGAVLVGNTLYLSGSIGLEDGGKVPDDAGEEARLVMNTIKAGVEAAGMTMDDIVSVQVFCSDVKHYQAFNDVYRTYFTREFPPVRRGEREPRGLHVWPLTGQQLRTPRRVGWREPTRCE